jgi:predicted phosphoribosyltransferase
MVVMDKSPYFLSRSSVGQEFAQQLADLRYENTAILALSPGGVVIAIEIAKQLHSIAGLLLLKHVYLPGGKTAFGVVNERGGFTHDQSISVAEIEEFEMEYRNNLEAEKERALHELHVIGQKGTLIPEYFNGRNVIIVNDFAKTGTAFQAALDFLKPAKTEKIILVSAIAQEKAIDVMHHLGDKVLIAHATIHDFPSEHYFVNNEIPQSKALVQMMEQVILQW